MAFIALALAGFSFAIWAGIEIVTGKSMDRRGFYDRKTNPSGYWFAVAAKIIIACFGLWLFFFRPKI